MTIQRISKIYSSIVSIVFVGIFIYVAILVSPKDNVVASSEALRPIGPGSVVYNCRFGVNSAFSYTIFNGAGSKFLEKNYNIGWALGIVNDFAHMNSVQLASTIEDLSKSGTRFIMRPCPTTDISTCDILSPLLTNEAEIVTAAEKYSIKLAKLAIELENRTKSNGYDISVWPVAGPNEPDIITNIPKIDAVKVSKYMNSVIYHLSTLRAFQCAISTSDEDINAGNYNCGGVLTAEDFYKYRKHINLLSPVMSLADIDYLDEMKNAKADFGGLVGISMNMYVFDAAGNTMLQQLRDALKYAKDNEKKLFFLETGLDPVDNKPIYSAATDEWAKKYEYDMISQLLTNPYIEAVLLFNGAPLGESRIRGYAPPGKTFAQLTDLERSVYDRDQYYLNNKLENVYTKEYPRVKGKLTELGLPDLSDKEHWRACRYYMALKLPINPQTGRNEVLDKQGEVADTDKYYAMRANSFSNTYYGCIYGDIAEPTTGVNNDWTYWYESQIYDFMESAGCANKYTYSCSNENLVKTDIESGKILTNDPSQNSFVEVERLKYKELSQDVINVEDFSEDIYLGYYDLPDKELKYGDVEIGNNCNGNICEVTTLLNTPIDVLYSGNIITTARLNVPTTQALVNTTATGTEDLNFIQYGNVVNRMNDDNSYDMTRKVNSNIRLSTGSSIPYQIGTAVELYGYDYLDYAEESGVVLEPNVISDSFKISNYYNGSLRNYYVGQNGTDFRTTNQAMKSLSAFYGKFLFSSITSTNSNSPSSSIPYYIVKVNGDMRDNQYSKLQEYTLEEIQTAQVTPSEIMSDEYIVNTELVGKNTTTPYAYEVSCSHMFKPYQDTYRLLGDSNAKVTLENTNNSKGSKASTYSYNVPCDNFPTTVVRTVKRNKLTGAIIETKNSTQKISVLNPVCLVNYCRKDPARIADPNTKLKQVERNDLTTTNVFNDFFVISGDYPAPFWGYTESESLNPNEAPHGHFLLRAWSDPPTIESADGVLRIIRTAWENAKRMEYSNKTLSQIVSSSSNQNPIRSREQICINQSINAEATLYIRKYSISQFDRVSSGNISKSQCMNPNNTGLAGYKRPAINASTDYQITTAEFPWLGTVSLINQHLALVGFNMNSNENLLLKKCSSTNNYFMCLCDNASTNNIYKYDQMGIYLCRNGMLTYQEMVNEGFLNINLSDDKKKVDNLEYNPFKCNIKPISTIAPDIENSNISKNCESVFETPEIVKMVKDTSRNACIPPELLMAIWQNESNCAHPVVSATGNFADDILMKDNNAECIRRGDCDVRGPFQINSNTWLDVAGTTLFSNCLQLVNSSRSANQSERYYFGDGMCGSTLIIRQKASARGVEGDKCTNWTNGDIWKAAEGYLGSCSPDNPTYFTYCRKVVENSPKFKQYFI